VVFFIGFCLSLILIYFLFPQRHEKKLIIADTVMKDHSVLESPYPITMTTYKNKETSYATFWLDGVEIQLVKDIPTIVEVMKVENFIFKLYQSEFYQFNKREDGMMVMEMLESEGFETI
jgi:hypothetical protein